MQTKSIKEIVEVISGYGFRGAIKNVPSGNVGVIQASDLDGESLYINPALLKTIQTFPQRTSSSVQKDDVLISSRGGMFRCLKASIYDLAIHQKVVASSSVFILRVKDKHIILPEFLAIYLNSYIGQSQLDKIAIGSTIRTISKKELENLSIPIPDVQLQESLSLLQKNIQQQQKYFLKKIRLNEKFTEGVLQAVIKK